LRSRVDFSRVSFMERGRIDNLGFQILDIVGHMSLGTVDILDRLLSGGKYLSKERYRDLMKRRNARHEELDNELGEMREKQKFYSLLYFLQKSGLIEKKKRKNKTFWFITKKGLEKRKSILSSKEYQFPRKEKYTSESSQYSIIVIFDIPEKEKKKREWLRSVLKNLDFKMLQKSVWMGESKLPNNFLVDLEKLNLLSHIKIFSIFEKGNI